jgi:hypothetical protein
MMDVRTRRGLINRRTGVYRYYVSFVCQECGAVGVTDSLSHVPARCHECGWGQKERRRFWQRVPKKGISRA